MSKNIFMSFGRKDMCIKSNLCWALINKLRLLIIFFEVSNLEICQCKPFFLRITISIAWSNEKRGEYSNDPKLQ